MVTFSTLVEMQCKWYMCIAELDKFLSSKNFWLYSIYMHSVIMIELVRVHVRWMDGDELVVKRLGQCESGEG